MKQIEIRHEHPCSVERFWQLFFDEELQVHLYREVLEFRAREVRSKEESADQIRRTLHLVPKPPQNVPSALRKFMGDGIEYEERGVFDQKTRTQRLEIVPNRLTDRISIRGTIWVEPHGDGCRRILEMSIDVKMPMLGGRIEQRIADDVNDSYAKAAVFYNQQLQP